jgi:3-oxoacyl-[acyl-carrier protein] reductase
VDLGLTGETALVTGGSRGIGLAVVRELRAEGVRVVTGSRHPEEFPLPPDEGLCVAPLDVTQPASIAAFVETAVARFGAIHMLVNNAGKSYPGTFATLTDEDWRRDIDVKLMAQIRMARAVLPHMPDGGRIVNLSAVFGKQPDARFLASSVNRAGCAALTKTLAQELAPRAIRVNAVAVGLAYSGQWEGRPPAFFAEMAETFAVPLGRFGTPEEVAAAIVFVLSHRASYIDGVVLDVDGGMARYL